MSIHAHRFLLLFGGNQTSASGSDQLPNVPGIVWNEDESDNRPDFDIVLPSGSGSPGDAAVGDVLRIRNITLSNTYLTRTLTADDIAGIPFTVSGVSPLANGDYEFNDRLERAAGVSEWSASEDVTVNASTPRNVILIMRAR